MLPSMKTMLLGGLNGRVPVSLEKAISYQFQGEVMRTLPDSLNRNGGGKSAGIDPFIKVCEHPYM